VKVALTATPGTLAHFGPIEIEGEKSVGENIVRRPAHLQRSEVFSRREMRESQRKLYNLELFQFANIESKEGQDAAARRGADACDGRRGQASAADDGHRLRFRGEGAPRRYAGIT
jgi:outer membrane translocation and assembly module TamA